ncbi:T9SS type A sorting domain-containing protein [Hymenobacter chitinivorans]|uniref:Putative secreted protein (Por secretion system target) n=1 Tax=Hymenobacter chitinivorans DSM 11115 TaxID=1121954 RepID=A0A2M9BPX7_9BACT|nr:T9SS type A sorting domain-containing protein [Hymenobacter chitinivorans]PJJ59968.1 putative secreted protein (Por secretion system target) [Hymenobacter chitinivorans DSM 11115]
MKKILLPLSLLCGLGLSAQAQWVLQNTTNPETPPGFYGSSIYTVSNDVAWQLLREGGVANAPVNNFARTANGGVSWQAGSITGTNGYQAANIHAMDANTAYVAQFGAGGEILKTTNAGKNWTKVTSSSQYSAPGSFANWVYFFDANNGVTLGDPTSGYFEVYTTSNGGTTWTRVPSANLPTPLDAHEYGLVGSYFALGNTIWAGTSHFEADDATGKPARILKSTDRGLTWTASSAIPAFGSSGQISAIVMTDANNGIANNGLTMVYTTDGGTTWQPRTYTGNFGSSDISSVPGTNLIVSVGPNVASPTSLAQYGSSYSKDNGATWIDIDRNKQYTSVSFASRTAGYAGSFTDDTGAGGVYKATATILGTSRNAELQKALAVYPNPSASGVFALTLNSAIKAGTSVRVFDALGRQVLSQQLNATAIASQNATINLSKEKAGLYTLELRTENGVAQQKLVIE